jgi:hypothetical protein
MSRKRQDKALPEAQWHSCDDPHRLVSWSRRAANARRYLLLGCAIVRRWPGGVRSDLARGILGAIEEVSRPVVLPEVRLLVDVLAPRFPGVFQPEQSNYYAAVTGEGRRLLGEDAAWVYGFLRDVSHLRRASKSLPNFLIGSHLAGVRRAARTEVEDEVRRQAAARKAEAERQAQERGVLSIVFGALGAALTSPLWSVGSIRARDFEAEYRRLVTPRVAEARAALCAAVREVFGDPFRPWRPKADWLAAHDGAVRRIAEGIESAGDFSAMPVLGDALEDAGCADSAALEHCRNGGPHVPGCWVLDAILGH